MELLYSSLKPTMLLHLTRPELIGAALARWLTESVWEKELSTLTFRNNVYSIEKEISHRLQYNGTTEQRQRIFLQRFDATLFHFPCLSSLLSGQGKSVAYREFERLCVSKKLDP